MTKRFYVASGLIVFFAFFLPSGGPNVDYLLKVAMNNHVAGRI